MRPWCSPKSFGERNPSQFQKNILVQKKDVFLIPFGEPMGSTQACVEVEEWLSGRRHWFAKSAYALAHTMGSNPISSVFMPFPKCIWG